MHYKELLEKIQTYVNTCFDAHDASYCYHGLNHTQEVVKTTTEIADHYQLSDEDKFTVVAAAYFHDLGYIQGGSIEHELRSSKIAEDFLSKQNLNKEIIQKITSCIMATKMPQSPNNLLEKILCDADLYHLGTTDFFEKSRLMHQEIENTHDKKISKNLWRKMTILLFEEHEFHTDYVREKLSQSKKENLKNLLKENKKSKEKNDILKRPERGIETMFRITSSNNQRLSDMADNKANILLTVNSIILSLVVTVLLRKLDQEDHLLIPTIFLMLFVVLTMIFAILATIPKIPNGYFNITELESKKVNLLFFGNFYKMSYQEYEKGMIKTMDNSELLYGMLTKDVYSQGVSLGRKYVLLRYAYGIFMVGLVISVVAFCIAVSINFK